MDGKKKKPKGCLIAIGIVLILAFIGLGSGSLSNDEDNQEEGWITELKEEKVQAEELFSADLAPEEKASQAQSKMLELEDQISAIEDETDQTQADYPLIRAYVDVREMYVAIKHIAENDQAETYQAEYQQANSEATQILDENYN